MNQRYMILALLAAMALVFAACGDDDEEAGPGGSTASPAAAAPFFDCAADHPGTSPDATGFPVTAVDGNGDSVSVDSPPGSIASLDAAHTEMLYAIGAGDQVTAVDNTSNCPVSVEELDHLDAFNPSVEAITALQPELVILGFAYDPDLIAGLRNAGLTVLTLPAPADIDGIYEQVELLGKVTGHPSEGDALISSMRDELQTIVGEHLEEDGPTFYHELDNQYFSVGPGSFIDEIYGLLGGENIADPTGEPYPQLSTEAIIAANPEVIILADEGLGETAETVAARPGWDAVSAVQTDRIYGVDPDIASRPGPRIVDLAQVLVAYLYGEAGP